MKLILAALLVVSMVTGIEPSTSMDYRRWTGETLPCPGCDSTVYAMGYHEKTKSMKYETESLTD